jgi:predicted DNA-binding transcriptional regulator YafY
MIDISRTTRTTLLIEECMEIFGVSRRTIYYWIRDRILIGVESPDRGVRVDIESVRVRLTCRTPPGLSASVQPLHDNVS